MTMEVADAKGKTKLHYVVMGGNAQLHGAQGKSEGLASKVDGNQTTTAELRAGSKCDNQHLPVTIPIEKKGKERLNSAAKSTIETTASDPSKTKTLKDAGGTQEFKRRSVEFPLPRRQTPPRKDDVLTQVEDLKKQMESQERLLAFSRAENNRYHTLCCEA